MIFSLEDECSSLPLLKHEYVELSSDVYPLLKINEYEILGNIWASSNCKSVKLCGDNPTIVGLLGNEKQCRMAAEKLHEYDLHKQFSEKTFYAPVLKLDLGYDIIQNIWRVKQETKTYIKMDVADRNTWSKRFRIVGRCEEDVQKAYQRLEELHDQALKEGENQDRIAKQKIIQKIEAEKAQPDIKFEVPSGMVPFLRENTYEGLRNISITTKCRFGFGQGNVWAKNEDKEKYYVEVMGNIEQRRVAIDKLKEHVSSYNQANTASRTILAKRKCLQQRNLLHEGENRSKNKLRKTENSSSTLTTADIRLAPNSFPDEDKSDSSDKQLTCSDQAVRAEKEIEKLESGIYFGMSLKSLQEASQAVQVDDLMENLPDPTVITFEVFYDSDGLPTTKFTHL